MLNFSKYLNPLIAFKLKYIEIFALFYDDCDFSVLYNHHGKDS